MHFLITAFCPSLSYFPDFRATEYQTDVGKTPQSTGQIITHSSAVKPPFALEIDIGRVSNSKPRVAYINTNVTPTPPCNEVPHTERYRG